MLFSSTFFLFIFLPILLVLYFGLTRKQTSRNYLLLLASLIFYAWGEPVFVLIMLLCIGMTYIFGLLIERYRGCAKKSKWTLIAMVTFNLGLLGIFKYTGFLLESLNSGLGLSLPVPSITLPIGISFFTFQSISYVVDVYRQTGETLRNPLDVGLYISFFPQLIAGPIVRYETIAAEIKERRENEDDFAKGISRFIIGMAKKVILANQFALIADKAFALDPSSISVSFAWLGAISYMLQIFFDFSGYSDMAIGLGMLFGFRFNENFNRPYLSKSVSEFWRRWHISLGSWFRDYVYIPLGGSRTTKWKHARNIFVVWLLTGIWHGANWTFIAWGLYYGILLMLEKFTGFGKFLEYSKIVGHLYTVFIVLFGWILFRADSLSSAFIYMQSMFGLNDNIALGSLASLYIKENVILMIIGILACFPITFYLKGLFKGENVWVNTVNHIIGMVILSTLFMISVSYLVKGAYNPFIYFNF